jgi:glycosyltransferase involved in cell wall biosynthesis
MHRIRQWDVTTAARVDHFVANSHNVAHRIRKYYRRDSIVIPPPVDIERFGTPPVVKADDFYLCVGQLIPYKQVGIAVRAFNRLGKQLVVIGEGSQRAELRQIAGPTITFLERVDDETLRHWYARCRALVFTADEDFGIVPLEAMAAGKPVIAYGSGGVLETIVSGRTGLFFSEQTAEAVAAAVQRFESIEHVFDPIEIAAHARTFSKERFKQAFRAFVETVRVERRDDAEFDRPSSRPYCMINGLTDQSASCVIGILHVVGDGAAGGGTTVVLQLARGLRHGAPGSPSQASRILPYRSSSERRTLGAGAEL